MPFAMFMLAVMIMYIPFQGNLINSLGVMGLNMFNIMFAIALIAVLLQSRPAGQVTPRPPMTGVLVAYYAMFALALGVAFLRGTPHPVEDVVTLKTVVTYSLLYFLAYYSVRSAGQVRFLLGLILLTFVLASFEAILQGISYGLDDFHHQERASGPFGDDAGNSNFAGVFYAIFSSFSLAIALLGKNFAFRYRLLAMACYGIGCLAIVATFSRQAFLIVGVTTLLLALRRNPLIAVAVIAVMLAYPLWAPQGVVERIEMTQERTVTGEEVLENSAASRYELWNGAIQIIKRNPLGVGLNQFNHEVEPYLPEWVTARDAQNRYLRVAAETGLQGLVVFLLVLAGFFRIGAQIRQLNLPEARVLGTAFIVSVIAVCLGNIFSTTFAMGEIMSNFWIMAGLLARYLTLAQSGQLIAGTDSVAVPGGNIMRAYARWQRQPGEADR